ncbi:T9SS type A sorting domain-containing protein [candidate division WOR-3 bacterium]|nr:T9SS type A sorting domain-containing protein [candidate division WOR-3 bacterium]
MKTFAFFLGVILLPLSIQAGWSRTYGTAQDEKGFSVCQTSDGNYVVAGYSQPENSLWVLKTDENGDTVWTVASQEEWPTSRAYSVIETSEGDFVAAGYSAPFWDGKCHMTVVKFDADGNPLWTKGDWDWFENPPGSIGYSIQETADKGFIVTGATSHAFDEIDDLLLVKLDSDGDTVWTRTYGGQAPDCGQCVCQTADGGYIVAGYTMSALPWSFWLLKTDQVGDTLWTSGMVDWFFGSAYGVTETSDGGYMATGYVAPFEDGKYHFMVLKTNPDGDTLWSKWDFDLFPGELGGVGRCIRPTSDGNYILAGYTTGFLDEILDLLLIKISPAGDTQWTRTYGGEAEDIGYCVGQCTEGGYIAAGATKSFGAGGYDIWLLKTDVAGDTLSVSEKPVVSGVSNWHVLNPVGQRIVLCFKDCPSGFHANIFDASGRKVDEIRSSGQTGIVSWGEEFSPGVYFIRVESVASGSSKKVVLME